MRLTAVVGRAVAAGVLVMPLCGLVNAASVTPPPCQALALAPPVDQSRTALCYWYRTEPTPVFRLWRSTDGLKTWRERKASGLAFSMGSAAGQLFASPDYPHDRVVFLQTTDGLYQTSDGGDTFTASSPLVTTFGPDNLTAYSDDTPGSAAIGTKATVIYADPLNNASLKVQPPLHVPIAGSPDRDVRFLVPPGYPASGSPFVLANRVDTDGRFQAHLYGCTASFSCVDDLAAFPMGHTVRDAFFAPDFRESHLMYVVTQETAPRVSEAHLWRSVDSGRTFVECAVTAGLARTVRALDSSGINLGLAFASASRVFLRWGYAPETTRSRRAAALPANLLYRSDDGGRHWRLVGSARRPDQAGPRGSLPWPDGSQFYNSTSANRLWWADGSLVTLGADAHAGYGGPFCSRNLGVTWRRTC